MSSAEEFYKNADEHFRWAESAKTDRERAIFLQMAAAWLKVAQKMGGRDNRHCSRPPRVGVATIWVAYSKGEARQGARENHETFRPCPLNSACGAAVASQSVAAAVPLRRIVAVRPSKMALGHLLDTGPFGARKAQ